MQVRKGKPPGSGQLARTGVELSREARVRVQWMDYYRRTHKVAHTCRHFGISRQTFYRWQRRYDAYVATARGVWRAARRIMARRMPAGKVSKPLKELAERVGFCCRLFRNCVRYLDFDDISQYPCMFQAYSCKHSRVLPSTSRHQGNGKKTVSQYQKRDCGGDNAHFWPPNRLANFG
jgi:helix-turn-helix protein